MVSSGPLKNSLYSHSCIPICLRHFRLDLNRHVNEAFTISVVRTRTVTPLEFFWNIYSLLKSIFTTFLSLPGISTFISSVGADQIINAPGSEEAIMLFENFMSMILLVGSKPG